MSYLSVVLEKLAKFFSGIPSGMSAELLTELMRMIFTVLMACSCQRLHLGFSQSHFSIRFARGPSLNFFFGFSQQTGQMPQRLTQAYGNQLNILMYWDDWAQNPPVNITWKKSST